MKCAFIQCLTQSRVLQSSLGSSYPSAALYPCVAFAKLELQTLIVLLLSVGISFVSVQEESGI